MDEPTEYPTTFALLCAAILTSAVADVCGRSVAEVRRRGLDWALDDRRTPTTTAGRTAASNARAWLLGAPGVVTAEVACAAVGIRRERVVEILLGARMSPRTDRILAVPA
jgi:hypothetical protein